MKIEGYEEISEEDYLKLPSNTGALFQDWESGKYYYFKKAQKFPICFPLGSDYEIEVDELGDLYFFKHGVSTFVIENKEIPKLVKAVEKAKEVMKKK